MRFTKPKEYTYLLDCFLAVGALFWLSGISPYNSVPQRRLWEIEWTAPGMEHEDRHWSRRDRVTLAELAVDPWRYRSAAFFVPIACVLVFLMWRVLSSWGKPQFSRNSVLVPIGNIFTVWGVLAWFAWLPRPVLHDGWPEQIAIPHLYTNDPWWLVNGGIAGWQLFVDPGLWWMAACFSSPILCGCLYFYSNRSSFQAGLIGLILVGVTWPFCTHEQGMQGGFMIGAIRYIFVSQLLVCLGSYIGLWLPGHFVASKVQAPSRPVLN